MLNVLGKKDYVLSLIKNYQNWSLILLNRIVGKPIEKLTLHNGLIITGGKNNLILDLSDEIFIKEIYNPKYFKLKKDDLIIDIGANVGVFGLYAALKGITKIYAIEPIRKNVNYIYKNFKINKLEPPIMILAAISDKLCNRKFYLDSDLGHSHLVNDKKISLSGDIIKVKTTTLESVIRKNKINRVDFLKIDCEGEEGKIINSTPKYIWAKINKISIEYHDDLSSLSHFEMVKILKENGYKIRIKRTGESIGYIYAC